jgi:hypothetical protein
MFVLIHNQTGKYVAHPGSVKSYTASLENAHLFSTADDAERDRCVESERVAPVSNLLQSPK